MSPTNKSATMPIIDQAKGHPIDPDVIVPDGDASLHESVETETDRVDAAERKLPDGGRSPDLKESADDKTPGIAADWSAS